MEELKINGKAIYTTKGAAREYGRIGCNFYTGCPHECEYCYLKRGAPSKQLGGNAVQLKKCFKDPFDAFRIFTKEVERHLDECRKFGVFFSFTTDPMIDKTRALTLAAVGYLGDLGIRSMTLTKDASWINDPLAKLLLKDIKEKQYDVRFGFTLTGRDDMEPNASTNAERIEAMRMLHNSGIKTWASIEPVITWNYARIVIEASLDCCDHYKIGLRSGVKKTYYGPVSSGMSMDELTNTITNAGRTVYLKESARALLRRSYEEDYYNEILSRTVDMDGNKINVNENQNQNNE